MLNLIEGDGETFAPCGESRDVLREEAGAIGDAERLAQILPLFGTEA